MLSPQVSSAPSPRTEFGHLRRAVRNWYSAGVLAAVVMPTRVPPRGGLRETWLGRHVETFRMSDGFRIRCRLQDAGDLISVYVDGDYERMRVGWANLRSIIDVGSTVGSFTLWAARRSPRAEIVAVEPNPELYPYLLDNIRLNHLSGRVVCVAAALGATSGVASIEKDGMYSTATRFMPHWGGSGPTVKQLSLEGLLDETNTLHLDLLKIDCEGAEYDTILGASGPVLRRIRTIICEYHPVEQHDFAELVAHLTSSGFHVDSDRTEVGFLVGNSDI